MTGRERCNQGRASAQQASLAVLRYCGCVSRALRAVIYAEFLSPQRLQGLSVSATPQQDTERLAERIQHRKQDDFVLVLRARDDDDEVLYAFVEHRDFVEYKNVRCKSSALSKGVAIALRAAMRTRLRHMEWQCGALVTAR